jgi:isoaspartyl peptidase/L-asparaginase-like protein (Ntn-hydrolase superfamily)
VPPVVWPLAANQRRIAEALGRAGAAAVVRGIGEALAAARELMVSPEKRAALGRTAWNLVDGRGTERIVDRMEKLMGNRWSAKVRLLDADSAIGAGGIQCP